MKSSFRNGALAVALSLQSLVVFAQDDAPYTPRFTRQQQKAEALLDDCRKPEWPRNSLRNRHTGTVVLRFTIGADGRLVKQEVMRGTGDPALDEAAMKGLGACRFIPGSIDGKPVQSQALMQYVWTIE